MEISKTANKLLSKIERRKYAIIDENESNRDRDKNHLEHPPQSIHNNLNSIISDYISSNQINDDTSYLTSRYCRSDEEFMKILALKENKDLRSRLEKSMRQSRAADDSIHSLQGKVFELQQEIASLSSVTLPVSGNLGAVSFAEMDKIIQEMLTLSNEVVDASEAHNDLQDQVCKLKNNNIENINKIREMESEIKSLQNKVSSSSLKQSELESQLSTTRTDLRDMSSASALQTIENRSLLLKNEQLSLELQQCKYELHEQTTITVSAHQALEAAQIASQSLAESVRSLSQQYEDLLSRQEAVNNGNIGLSHSSDKVESNTVTKTVQLNTESNCSQPHSIASITSLHKKTSSCYQTPVLTNVESDIQKLSKCSNSPPKKKTFENPDKSHTKRQRSHNDSIQKCCGLCADPPYGLMVSCSKCGVGCHSACVKKLTRESRQSDDSNAASVSRRWFCCKLCSVL